MNKKGGTSCSRRNRQDERALGERRLGTVRWPSRRAQQRSRTLAWQDLAAQ
ncbi:hypothetical protein HMPREF9057_01395 [Actinomyces sp. oral taxon 171 str. F0337]|nr:hypothetical protein HMPREF9057_01395 [Actinomyces sp. oral taxon 171 str. F0337]